MIIKKDSKIVKAKVERKSIALKAKKESSDEECSTSDLSKPRRTKTEKSLGKGKALECGDSKSLIENVKATEDKNQRHLLEVLGAIAMEEDRKDPKMRHDLYAQAPNEDNALESIGTRRNGSRLRLLRGNIMQRKIEESLNVTFDETPPPSKTSPLVGDDLDEEEAIREIKKKNLENVVEDGNLEIDVIVNIKEI
ncbi:hypothetical protein Tco_1439390 [Tanacetum coccineum]